MVYEIAGVIMIRFKAMLKHCVPGFPAGYVLISWSWFQRRRGHRAVLPIIFHCFHWFMLLQSQYAYGIICLLSISCNLSDRATSWSDSWAMASSFTLSRCLSNWFYSSNSSILLCISAPLLQLVKHLGRLNKARFCWIFWPCPVIW
jgi:hypothetical protein